MDDLNPRVEELRNQAAQVRIRAIETNEALIAELTGIWTELNELAGTRTELRKVCERIAGDIARLERLDLAFDTEWLEEAKRARP